MIDFNKLLEISIAASLNAGEEILKVYETDFIVERKEDRSPLTLADKNSHDVISKMLAETGIPVLSEEGKDIPFSERKNWKYLWIVDPLDGTKEFVKRNGEFTVNIALTESQKPVLGVIYVPVTKVLYFAAKGIGAFKNSDLPGNYREQFSYNKILKKSIKLPGIKKNEKFTIIASRSHLTKETWDFIEEMKKKHGETNVISAGSSLKFCLIAEGKANVYPRFAPTMEWDTAAGQAIVQCAGKNVIDFKTKKIMLYNKENLLNGWFLVE